MAYSVVEIDGVIIRNTHKFPVEITPESHAIGDTAVHTGKLHLSQIPDDVMFDSEHHLDPHTMIIDGRDVSQDGSKLDTIEIGAQVNNLTNQQAHSLTSGSHSNWHNHDDWYYRKTQLQIYGESEVHWGNITNKPSTYLPSQHDHNDLYYTQTQLNSGQLDTRYYTETEIDNLIAGVETFGIKGGVDIYSDLPLTSVEGDIYIVRQSEGLNLEGFYRYDGTTWIFLARNTGNDIGIHNDLQGLNDGDFRHLTTTQFSGLTSGNNTTLHHHDGKYYTQTQINTLLDNKSNIDHIHDDRYYTETEIDSLLTQKSNINHNHDDLYYLKNQVDTFLSGKSNIDHLHDDRYFTEAELQSANDGESGSSLIGSYPLSGLLTNTVRGQLVELQSLINNITVTLQAAYTSGRTITINSGPVEINSTTSTNAPLMLNNRNDAPSTNLLSGQVAIVDNILYIYDGSRNKWLSQSKFLAFGRNNNSDGHILFAASAEDFNTGYRMIRQGTIISASLQSTQSVSGKTINIMLNGMTTHTLITSNGAINVKNLNLDFNENDIIAVYSGSGGGALRNVVLLLEISWRT